MARDEDIFRKLKKQTPIAKRKDIQPLSTQDFSRKSSAVRSASPGRRAEAPELSVFSASVKTKKADKRGAALASRYNSSRQQPAAELNVFGETQDRPVRASVQRQPAKVPAKSKPAARQSLQFAEPERAPKTCYTERSSNQAAQLTHTDLHDTDYLRDTAAAGQLNFRHELKFYINYHDYVLLRNTIKTLLAVDRNADENGHYHIRSVYFDDVNESALREKIAGTDDRYKYRIRFYNYSDNIIRFEKKIKQGQYISKVSIRLTREESDSLIAGDFSVLEGRPEPLANEIWLQMKNYGLSARVIVDYWREAFVSSIENVRITFDKDLKGGLWLSDVFSPQTPTMPVLDEGMMVLEVKFDRYLPEYIKAILSNVNAAHRSAISKYVLCRKFD